VNEVGPWSVGGVGGVISSISCPAAGSCSAAGSGLVVKEARGVWGKAEQVPWSPASVSCSSAGSCGAGGYYVDASGKTQAFVVDETKGKWGKAKEVPGTAILNKGGGGAWVASLSCTSPGDCSAGGSYVGNSRQAFVVDETKGKWGNAKEVPGTAILNKGGNAGVDSLSCASRGDCSAGGRYSDASGKTQAFVVDETEGKWGKAIEVPGTATLHKGGNGGLSPGAGVASLSCASAGSCSAGGSYVDASDHSQAFVVDETKGKWGNAKEVPGTAKLNKEGSAGVYSVSCASAGSCSAGGWYSDSQAFVVDETNGKWGKAQEVPRTAP
jgi:hypothetical protein